MDGHAGWGSGRGYAVGMVLVVATLGGGCAGDDDGVVAPPHVSGTRLRARLLDGGGGAVSFLGWHDRELDLDCTFTDSTDGVQRCLPRVDGWVGYADPDCTQPAVGWPFSSCDHPPSLGWERVVEGDACQPARVVVREVGALLGSGPLHALVGGRCWRVWGDGPLYAPGPAVELSRFASAVATSLDERGDRLVVTRLTTADGASQIIGAVDPVRGPCHRAWLPTGEGVCLAASGSGGQHLNVFRDDACSTPVPGASNDCPERAPAVIFADDGAAYLPGARIDAPTFGGSVDACAAQTGYTAYELGRPATGDDFPRMAASLTGSGRAQAQYATDLSGRPLLAEGFYDAERGAPCDAVRVDGDPGARRCMEYNAFGSSTSDQFYADPACADPIMQWSSDPGIVGRVFEELDDSCGERALRSLYTVVEHDGPTYLGGPGACVENTPGWDLRPFVRDETISLDTLPRLVERTE